MILKFDEYVYEGFINKTLKRTRTGEVRTEDKFTQSDTHFFNFEKRKIYDFLRDHAIYDKTYQELPEILKDKYRDEIVSYTKSHGTMTLGFWKGDKSTMSDFDFSFHIEDLKNVKIFMEYIGQNRELKIFCGNNKEDFDITDTTFGEFLKKVFGDTIKDVLEENPDLLISNMERHWDDFYPELEKCVYKACYDDFEYDRSNGRTHLSDLEIIEIIPNDYSIELEKFQFEGVSFQDGIAKVFVVDKDISDTDLAKKIVDIYYEQYDAAVAEIEQNYPDEGDGDYDEDY